MAFDPKTLAIRRRDVEVFAVERASTLSSPSAHGLGAIVDWGWPTFFFYLVTQDNAGAIRTAGDLVADAKLSLFGRWRIGYLGFDEERGEEVVWDHTLARASFNWFNSFTFGLAAAGYLDDWSSVVEIAAYTEGSPLPSYLPIVSPQWTADDAAIYMELSRVIRGERMEVDAATPYAVRRPRPRHQLLREAVIALGGGDVEAVSRALTAYLRHYHARERERDVPIDRISVDGMILYHVARHLLGRAPELEKKLLASIPRREQPFEEERTK